MGMQTSTLMPSSNRGVTEVEVIKSVEQILSLTDTASDGTNRMSTTQIKGR